MKLPQLTLRDLFWLVALVAMGCAWWADRWQMRNEVEHSREVFSYNELLAMEREHQLRLAIEAEGYRVHWNKENWTASLSKDSP